MPKPKGSPKTGGRQKGSLNKSTLLRPKIEDILARYDDGKGFDPVTEAMNLYTLIHADNPLVAVKILLALMEYLYPKKRSIETSIRELKRIQVEVSDGRTYTVGEIEASPETE